MWQRPKKFFQKHVILTVILVLIVLTAIGSQSIQERTGQDIWSNSNVTASAPTETTSVSTKPIEKAINIGETIKGKDWEITISEAKFSQRVDPPEKSSSFYQYYQVEDTSNTYFCVILDCKNISNLELKADKVAKVSAKYNNQYNYSSFSTMPEKNLGFTYTNITNIKPLTSNKIYYLAEMPNTISTETDTPVDIQIDFENQKYVCHFR